MIDRDDEGDDEDRTNTQKKTALLDIVAAIDAQSVCLVVVGGSASTGKIFKIDREMIIGRGDAADILLKDYGISRKHTRVALNAQGAIEVHDLGSTNGTYHNGTRVDACVARDGDKVRIGDAVLAVIQQNATDEVIQSNLYDSATRDHLTRTFNRRYFSVEVERQFVLAQRHRAPLSLVAFEVDQQRQIVAAHGRAACAYALREVARKVREHVRVEDTLARWSDERFVLLLADVPEGEALTCAEWLCRATERLAVTYEGARFSLTVSAGVAVNHGGQYDSASELVDSAQRRCDTAKLYGRNRVASE